MAEPLDRAEPRTSDTRMVTELRKDLAACRQLHELAYNMHQSSAVQMSKLKTRIQEISLALEPFDRDQHEIRTGNLQQTQP